MRYFFLDIFAAVVLSGGIVAAWGFGTVVYRKTVQGRIGQLRALGAKNAETEVVESELVCLECGKAVDPAVDMYVTGAWFHPRCHKEAS